jgi:hypothetical protein
MTRQRQTFVGDISKEGQFMTTEVMINKIKLQLELM